jgi:membrane-associated phospholipid phosphatase
VKVKIEDQRPAGVSRRLVQRARERLDLRDGLYVLPAFAYSIATIGDYLVDRSLLQFLPAVFLLAAVPLIAMFGSSRDTMRPWIPFVTIMLCYEALQGIIGNLVDSRTLFSIYSLDKAVWGFNVTGWVQSTFYSPTMTMVTTFFYSLHLPLVVITSVALWRFNRQVFGKYVTAMVLTSYAALITFILIPTAPPWYQGVAHDLFYGGSSSSLPNGVLYVVSVFESDKFASFPSLHAAYAILFSYFMIKLDRRLGFVAIPITAGILFSTVYLGQHYLLDLLAGALYALVPCLIAERLQIGLHGIRRIP